MESRFIQISATGNTEQGLPILFALDNLGSVFLLYETDTGTEWVEVEPRNE